MAERPNAAVLKTVGRAASRGFESPSLRQMLLQSPSPSEARSPSQPRAGGSNPQGRPRRERAPRALEQRAREGRRPEAGRGRRSRTRNPPLSASRLFLLRNLLRPGAPCSHAQGGSNPQGRETAETRERFPAGARGPQARSGARAAEPAAESPSLRQSTFPAAKPFEARSPSQLIARGIRTRKGARLRKRASVSQRAREGRRPEAGRGRRSRPRSSHRPPRITKTCRLESHQVQSFRSRSPHGASRADPLRACPRPSVCGLALRGSRRSAAVATSSQHQPTASAAGRGVGALLPAAAAFPL